MANTTDTLPPIVFVMETETPPGNFIERSITMTQAELDTFANAWQQLKPHVLAHVKPDSLLRISRWAVAEMKAVTLSSAWFEKIPLRPIASSADDRLVRFAQFKEEGYPLPSHHPLVFRRLLLYVDYDRHAQTIAQIFVTISGWVEE
ncbi:hypothetical protein HUU05_12810 [candidate division KSB1 bacterium]|nr:hypothetical protein [candidate division KSB1 bacterium]